jgi:hypothetical protein
MAEPGSSIFLVQKVAVKPLNDLWKHHPFGGLEAEANPQKHQNPPREKRFLRPFGAKPRKIARTQGLQGLRIRCFSMFSKGQAACDGKILEDQLFGAISRCKSQET